MDCKWTRRDYKLAKILMEFGIETIFRTETNVEARDCYECFTLPKQAFSSLKVFDSYWLCDIVYEYESYC